MKKFFLLITIFLLLNSIQIFPQKITKQNDYRFDKWFGILIEGGPNFINGDTKSPAKMGISIGLGSEYFFSTRSNHLFGMKLVGSYHYLKGLSLNTALLSGTDYPNFKTNLYNGKAGLIYGYDIGSFVPYISVGLSGDLYYKTGYVESLPEKKSSKIKIGYYLEGGAKIPLSKIISMNLNFVYNATGNDELDGFTSGTKKDTYFSIMLGLSFNLNKKKVDSDGDGVPDDVDKCPNTPKGIKVDEFGCSIDSDGDGIPDYLDKCLDTPKGLQVDSNGCPLDTDKDGVPDYLDNCPLTLPLTKVDKHGCPVLVIDSDEDGVLDSLDRCINTPQGVKVDSCGCPIDSDGDGIPDYLDKCSDTPKGVKVDKDGCAIAEVKKDTLPKEQIIYIYSESAIFEKMDLNENGKKELTKLANKIKSQPKSLWRIESHSDSVGTMRGNLKSTEARAKTIENYLISLGIKKEQLISEGMGRKYPVRPNTTPDNKFKNRRVVIIKIK